MIVILFRNLAVRITTMAILLFGLVAGTQNASAQPYTITPGVPVANANDFVVLQIDGVGVDRVAVSVTAGMTKAAKTAAIVKALNDAGYQAGAQNINGDWSVTIPGPNNPGNGHSITFVGFNSKSGEKVQIGGGPVVSVDLAGTLTGTTFDGSSDVFNAHVGFAGVDLSSSVTYSAGETASDVVTAWYTALSAENAAEPLADQGVLTLGGDGIDYTAPTGATGVFAAGDSLDTGASLNLDVEVPESSNTLMLLGIGLGAVQLLRKKKQAR
jgi:hypothetical protein